MNRAFTLLEVLVALAILGFTIISFYGGAVQSLASRVYSEQLTAATILARGKIIALEQELYDEPLSPTTVIKKGDFSEEGFAEFFYQAAILPPNEGGKLTPDDLVQSFVQGMFGSIFGAELLGGAQKKSEGPLGGILSGLLGNLPALGALGGGAEGALAAAGGGGLLGGAALEFVRPQLLAVATYLQEHLREIQLHVYWQDQKGHRENIDFTTHILHRGPNSDRNQGISGGAVPPNSPTPTPVTQ